RAGWNDRAACQAHRGLPRKHHHTGFPEAGRSHHVILPYEIFIETQSSRPFSLTVSLIKMEVVNQKRS
ncbi:hypothetical protein ACC745_39005, partial [Rhizobium ruizarguesonis]